LICNQASAAAIFGMKSEYCCLVRTVLQRLSDETVARIVLVQHVLAPVAVDGITDADRSARRYDIAARRQMQLDFTQQLQISASKQLSPLIRAGTTLRAKDRLNCLRIGWLSKYTLSTGCYMMYALLAQEHKSDLRVCAVIAHISHTSV